MHEFPHKQLIQEMSVGRVLPPPVVLVVLIVQRSCAEVERQWTHVRW